MAGFYLSLLFHTQIIHISRMTQRSRVDYLDDRYIEPHSCFCFFAFYHWTCYHTGSLFSSRCFFSFCALCFTGASSIQDCRLDYHWTTIGPLPWILPHGFYPQGCSWTPRCPDLISQWLFRIPISMEFEFISDDNSTVSIRSQINKLLLGLDRAPSDLVGCLLP